MPRDDDGDDCKRSSKACESKGDDDYVTAVGSALPSAAEPKAALGLRGLDISAVVKSERNPRPCAEHERVERASSPRDGRELDHAERFRLVG